MLQNVARNPGFFIGYGTGAVEGVTVNDTLKVGAITVPRQAIGGVLRATADFTLSSCDGLFVSAMPSTPSHQAHLLDLAALHLPEKQLVSCQQTSWMSLRLWNVMLVPPSPCSNHTL